MYRNNSLRISFILVGFVAVWFVSSAFGASGQIIYSNSFTGGAGSEWSSSTTSTANGEIFLAESSEGSGPGSNTLSLTGLPEHSSITVTFDLYIIESWDGNGEFCCGPDTWQLWADGNLVFTSNFANYTGGNTQAYPAQIPPNGPGATNPVGTGASATGHLGFGSGDFGDRTYSLSFTVPHSASSIDLAFVSGQDQAAGDEGWGLDNVTVTVPSQSGQTAPIPASGPLGLAILAVLLLIIGVIGLGRKIRTD